MTKRCHGADIFKIRLGGLHENYAVQHEIWAPNVHLLQELGKPRKILIHLARRRIAWCMLSNAKIPLNYISRFNPYLAVNTHRLSYKIQSIDAVQGNNRCLFSDPHRIHKSTTYISLSPTNWRDGFIAHTCFGCKPQPFSGRYKC